MKNHQEALRISSQAVAVAGDDLANIVVKRNQDELGSFVKEAVQSIPTNAAPKAAADLPYLPICRPADLPICLSAHLPTCPSANVSPRHLATGCGIPAIRSPRPCSNCARKHCGRK